MEHDPLDPDRLERYLDGLLDPAAAAEFERALARSPELARGVAAEAAAQAAVDAFLARRFPSPAAPAAPSAPARLRPLPVRPTPAESVAPVGIGRTGWLSAAALVLGLGLALGFALRGKDERTPADGGSGAGDSVARADAQGRAGTGVTSPTPEPGERRLVPVSIPDLGALYASLAEGRSNLLEWGGPPDATLESRLAERYDECLDVSSTTCALLGPFASTEWPSAAVLVAFCEGVDGAPTLLVVDDQTMHGCGMTPRTGGLSPFYKEVNGLAVWEVTDADQPRLLDSVRSCAK
jgi:hypothetical protein